MAILHFENRLLASAFDDGKTEARRRACVPARLDDRHPQEPEIDRKFQNRMTTGIS